MKFSVKIVFLLAVVVVSSCKKYEDGPSFSLMSKKARLANIWYVDKYIVNDVDKTADYRQGVTRERLVIFQSGKFEYSEISSWVWAPMSYTGTWNFINDKEGLELHADDPSVPVQTYRILRLKNDELWMDREVISGFVTEYHYLPID